MIIIADIGGTRMRIAASDELGSFEEPVAFDTPSGFDDALGLFTDSVREIAHGRPIAGGIVGIAGLVSADRQTLLKAPHLQAWIGKDIAAAFGRAIGAPVRLENDAALAALGEAQQGAGAGAGIVAYVTAGTGIGGARIVDGSIDRSAFGFEIGHQRLGSDMDAPEWETFASGSGLEKRYGKTASALTDPAIWEACADHFAIGLYNTILHWSPDRVVLGGSLFVKEAIPLERVRATLRAAATALEDIPEIRLATLGDRSGLYGASIAGV